VVDVKRALVDLSNVRRRHLASEVGGVDTLDEVGNQDHPLAQWSAAPVMRQDAPVPSSVSPGYESVVSSSVFDVYDELLVPLVFQAYADDVARRLGDLRAGSVLEVAAGTGVVTRALADALPDAVTITATDLVPGMVDRARQVGTSRPVTWEHADVMALPYEPESFDVVVCQFGAMFFEPKRDAFAEVRRVLRPGGRFLMSVWDGFERNEFGAVVNDALKEHFPEDPPLFLERKPYSYHDREAIIADLRDAGFDAQPAIEQVEHESHAAAPGDVAAAFVCGTPLRDAIEGRGPGQLVDALTAVGAVLADRFGPADVQSRISAQLVVIVR
jgi:ubiquinone/menaquinone biosynthesis C-methylase UbiE